RAGFRRTCHAWAGVQLPEHLDKLTMDPLEYRRMLGHGQLIKLAKRLDRGVDPGLAGFRRRHRLRTGGDRAWLRLPRGLGWFAVVQHRVLPPVRNATVLQGTVTPLEALGRPRCPAGHRQADNDRESGVTMATAEECRMALESLTDRLTKMDAAVREAK